MEKVYFESLYQINELPTDPMVLHYRSHPSGDTSISLRVDPVDGEKVIAYEWFPEGKEQPDEDNDESYELYPFMEFK